MSYRNPRLVVDTKLGDAFIDYVKDVEQSIAQTTVNYAQVAKKNREKNFELRKKISQYESDVNRNLAKIAVKNNVNSQSLISGTQTIVDKLAQAKMRYNSSSSYYDGMKEDESFINSTEMFLSVGLEQQLGAVASITDLYNESILNNGMDGKGGSVSASSDPRFQVFAEAQNPNNNIDASIRYEIVNTESGTDVLLITEGKAIEELNKAEGIEGDSYTISANNSLNQTLASGASPYNFPQWSLVPSIMGGDVEGVPDLTKSLKEEGVLGRDGNFTDEYVKDYGTYMKSEEVKGYGKVPVIANKRAVDIDAASAMLQTSTNARVNTLLGFKGSEVYDYVRTNSKEVEIDGKTYFSHPPVEGRDENGNVKRGEEILILEDELANRNYEKFGKTGYSDDVIKAVQKIGLDDALKRTGALNNPIEKTKTAPQYMQPRPRSEEANLITDFVRLASETINSGKGEQINYSMLDGINGYSIKPETDKDGNVTDPYSLVVYDKLKDKEMQPLNDFKIDLRNESDAENKLLRLFGAGVKGVIEPKEKIEMPPIVSDLTDPVKNFKENISEETFMDSLSDDYLKKMSQLGIGLEETSIGSDVILMTKPNGQEVEIDLEKKGWKDEFERNMKGAILMSPSYKQFVSQTKNQEVVTDINEIKELDLPPISKNKKKDDFYKQLAMSESSGDYRAEIVDDKGRRFVGLYQFGKGRLNDYKEATGESFTQEEFRLDSDLQDKVARWHFEGIDKKINSLGDLTKGYSRNGLMAVAHLGGKQGMVDWLKAKENLLKNEDGSPKEYNPSDSLKTSLDKYYNQFK